MARGCCSLAAPFGGVADACCQLLICFKNFLIVLLLLLLCCCCCCCWHANARPSSGATASSWSWILISGHGPLCSVLGSSLGGCSGHPFAVAWLNCLGHSVCWLLFKVFNFILLTLAGNTGHPGLHVCQPQVFTITVAIVAAAAAVAAVAVLDSCPQSQTISSPFKP